MSIIPVRCLLVVTVLVIMSLPGCGVFNKTAEQYLSASQSYFNQGQYSASLIEIKNAIQQDPDNPLLRQFAARVYLKLGQGDDAAIQLTKAISLGADSRQLMPLYVQALYRQRQFKKLLAVKVPDHLTPENQSIIYVYQGFAAAQLNKQSIAANLYQKSLELDADNRLAYRGIALLHASRGEYDQALQLLDELIGKQPNDPGLWSLKGDIEVSNRQYGLAEESYTKAVEFDQENRYPHIAKRALACLSGAAIDCATKDLAELEKKLPGYYMTAYVKGLVAVNQKRWKDAQTALSDALAINPGLTPAYYFSGLAHFQQQQFGPAISRLSAFVASKPESVNGRHLLSLAQIKEGHYESAKTTLQPIIERGHIASAFLYLLGQIEYALGNISSSIRYFKELSQRHPESALAHAQLGLKLLASGDQANAQDELAVAIDIAPDLLEVGQASVLAYLESKQYAKAQALLDKMQANTKHRATLLNLQGLLYLRQGYMRQASESFQQALQVSPGDPAASQNLARIKLQQGDYHGAIQYYRQVLKHHPGHVPTHLKLAELELKRGDEIKAEQRLLGLINQQPQALAPRIMLAKYYLISGRVDSVKDLLEPVAALYPDDARLLTLSAESLLASGHSGQAKREAQILVNKIPDSANAQWLLTRAAIADQDKFKTEHALKQTLLLKPDHIPAQIVQIKLFTESKQLQQAVNQLKSLLSQAPDDPRVGAIAAWFALKTGDFDKALTLYNKVYLMSASSANALGLAQAQWQTGQHDKAVNTLQAWTLKNPDDVKAQLRLALMYQAMGLAGDASARFNRVLLFEPDNVVALNNLAWLLRNEYPAKALQYIEKAVELEPENASVYDTLGVVLLLQGNVTRALRVLQRAFRAYPDQPSIQYHYALALHRNSQSEQAIEVLQKLLTSNAKFSERSQAGQLLNKLKMTSAISG